jgi:hypothetical protein
MLRFDGQHGVYKTETTANLGLCLAVSQLKHIVQECSIDNWRSPLSCDGELELSIP